MTKIQQKTWQTVLIFNIAQIFLWCAWQSASSSSNYIPQKYVCPNCTKISLTMKFSVYKLFCFNSCINKITRALDRCLDRILWHASEFLKLYFIGLTCLLDEFPTKWWRRMREYMNMRRIHDIIVFQAHDYFM